MNFHGLKMPVQERISHGARLQAYINARHLGVEPQDALIEANDVAEFIRQIGDTTPIHPEPVRAFRHRMIRRLALLRLHA